MTTPDSNSSGFVGLGAMGMPIAVRLASGLGRLLVADTSQDRVDATLAAAGPSARHDIDGLRNARTIFLCLPSQTATRSVVDWLLDGPTIPRTFIDFGAYPPDFVSAMVDLCEARSAQFCDCPVFGTPSMAERGELYFLFSGPHDVHRAFGDLVGPLGYRLRHAGASGAASTMKLLQNALGTANLAIGAEALRICEAAGLETKLFIDIVRECGGIGLSTVFDRFANDMAARRDSGEGRLRIAAKDMQSVEELAASRNITVPLLQQTAHVFQDAMQAGLGERQFTDIIKLGTTGKPDRE